MEGGPLHLCRVQADTPQNWNHFHTSLRMDPSPATKNHRRGSQSLCADPEPRREPRIIISASLLLSLSPPSCFIASLSHLSVYRGTQGLFDVSLYFSQLCSQGDSHTEIFNLMNRFKPRFYFILSRPASVLSIKSLCRKQPAPQNPSVFLPNSPVLFSFILRLPVSLLSFKKLHSHSHALN